MSYEIAKNKLTEYINSLRPRNLPIVRTSEFQFMYVQPQTEESGDPEDPQSGLASDSSVTEEHVDSMLRAILIRAGLDNPGVSFSVGSIIDDPSQTLEARLTLIAEMLIKPASDITREISYTEDYATQILLRKTLERKLLLQLYPDIVTPKHEIQAVTAVLAKQGRISPEVRDAIYFATWGKGDNPVSQEKFSTKADEAAAQIITDLSENHGNNIYKIMREGSRFAGDTAGTDISRSNIVSNINSYFNEVGENAIRSGAIPGIPGYLAQDPDIADTDIEALQDAHVKSDAALVTEIFKQDGISIEASSDENWKKHARIVKKEIERLVSLQRSELRRGPDDFSEQQANLIKYAQEEISKWNQKVETAINIGRSDKETKAAEQELKNDSENPTKAVKEAILDYYGVTKDDFSTEDYNSMLEQFRERTSRADVRTWYKKEEDNIALRRSQEQIESDPKNAINTVLKRFGTGKYTASDLTDEDFGILQGMLEDMGTTSDALFDEIEALLPGWIARRQAEAGEEVTREQEEANPLEIARGILRRHYDTVYSDIPLKRQNEIANNIRDYGTAYALEQLNPGLIAEYKQELEDTRIGISKAEDLEILNNILYQVTGGTLSIDNITITDTNTLLKILVEDGELELRKHLNQNISEDPFFSDTSEAKGTYADSYKQNKEDEKNEFSDIEDARDYIHKFLETKKAVFRESITEATIKQLALDSLHKGGRFYVESVINSEWISTEQAKKLATDLEKKDPKDFDEAKGMLLNALRSLKLDPDTYTDEALNGWAADILNRGYTEIEKIVGNQDTLNDGLKIDIEKELRKFGWDIGAKGSEYREYIRNNVIPSLTAIVNEKGIDAIPRFISDNMETIPTIREFTAQKIEQDIPTPDEPLFGPPPGGEFSPDMEEAIRQGQRVQYEKDRTAWTAGREDELRAEGVDPIYGDYEPLPTIRTVGAIRQAPKVTYPTDPELLGIITQAAGGDQQLMQYIAGKIPSLKEEFLKSAREAEAERRADVEGMIDMPMMSREEQLEAGVAEAGRTVNVEYLENAEKRFNDAFIAHEAGEISDSELEIHRKELDKAQKTSQQATQVAQGRLDAWKKTQPTKPAELTRDQKRAFALQRIRPSAFGGVPTTQQFGSYLEQQGIPQLRQEFEQTPTYRASQQRDIDLEEMRIEEETRAADIARRKSLRQSGRTVMRV